MLSGNQRHRNHGSNAVSSIMWHRTVLAALVAMTITVASVRAADTPVERGRYLVLISGCSDCHTPGYFLGHPDMSRFLGGSDVGFAVPGLGVFVGPNLTSDKATGLGKWTAQEIVTAITTGVRPDGRVLAPPMPWRGLANLAKSDAMAMAAYLQSLPPVSNKVAGPFGPNETPDVFVMSVQPGPAYAHDAR
jgi:mono/diheme cytochrome c family protein